MPIDTNPFKNLKTYQDYSDQEQAKAIQQQLVQAQISKANQFDIDQVGQQAFVKASQGMPLSPTEAASLQYLDSKSQTVAFNPVTGALEQKPGLLDRAGLASSPIASPAVKPSAPAGVVSPSFKNAMAPVAPGAGGGGDFLADLAPTDAPAPAPVNPWDAEFKQQFDSMAGNPKAQQELLTNYQKQKLLPNEEQAKNAAYADRMTLSNPVVSSPEQTKASMDTWDQRFDRNLPDWAANKLVSDDFQSAKQAQLDFLNAILRKESGAAISTGEYTNYAKQYFPQPGDSKAVVAQKAANREAALQGVQRSAGPSYKPVPVPDKAKDLYEKSKAEFDAGKIPQIASPADPAFAKLPSGSKFKGADGIIRVKH